jgi:hypothetical protein
MNAAAARRAAPLSFPSQLTLRRQTPTEKMASTERKAKEYTPAKSSTSPSRITTSSAERRK